MFLLICGGAVKCIPMSTLLCLIAVNRRYELKYFTASSDNQTITMEKRKSRAGVFKMNSYVPLGLLQGFRGKKKKQL